MPRTPISETPCSSKADEGGSVEGAASLPTSIRLLLIGVALGSGVFLAWQTAGALLMIFGGLLLAALLDAATRGLLHILPVGRGACFAIVCTIFAGLILVGIAWGGYTIVQEWDELHRVLTSQLKNIGNRLADMGVQTPGPRGGRITEEQIANILLPDPAGLFGRAQCRAIGPKLPDFDPISFADITWQSPWTFHDICRIAGGTEQHEFLWRNTWPAAARPDHFNANKRSRALCIHL